MMKPKVALVKSGFLPPGSENVRGRMSAAAIAECERLVREEGYQIQGFTLSKPTASADKSSEAKVERVSTDPNAIIEIPEETRPESSWVAYYYHDGKAVEVGMRTVCNLCRASLTYCHCDMPRVWLDHKSEGVVRFKERTSPLPNRKW